MRTPVSNEFANGTKPQRKRRVSGQTAEEIVVGEDTVITLNFVVRDDAGEVLDDMYEKTPFKFLYGQGDLPPGLEEGIRGMRAGQTETIVVPPDQAYGERDTDLVIRIDRNQLPSEDCVVGARYRRLNEDGETNLYTVVGYLANWVYLDRNHPWAGKELKYKVSIVEVLPV